MPERASTSRDTRERKSLKSTLKFSGVVPSESAVKPRMSMNSTAAFWRRDHEGPREWLVGHLFKYVYSFYDLLRHVDDAGERRALEAHLAYVLAPAQV